MADVTAALIKKVREITGAGMSDVKKALVAADGDESAAIEALRIKGADKAGRRSAERSVTNGLVAAAEGAMIELACETDFVAKNEQFQQLATDIVAHAAMARPATRDDLLAETLADGGTVAKNIESLNAVIGEKIELRRYAVLDGQVATYLHRRASDLPPQIGVIVAFEGDDLTAARGVAMQVSALRAHYVRRGEVPADIVAKEREIAEATAREQGKPEQAITKIVEGRVNGFFKDVVLLEQSHVQDSKKTVQAVLDAAGVTVTAFIRFEVGQS